MSQLKLTNSLSKQLEPFSPLKKKKVGFYSCGPTVYNYPHIGNMRTYILNDILKRTLEYNGYKVKHIMNITDVGHLTSDADAGEDKLEKASRRENLSAWDVALKYTQIFKDYAHQLNIQPPTKYVRATDTIKDQIKLVKKLDKQGYLYKTSDGLYFDTSLLDDYGKLATTDLDNIQEGARVTVNPEKKHATDFAVWKFSPEDKQRQMEWKSPWGTGFPGWHLECSVISTKYLGQPFDIHTGGVDHINIHHTNEIAQSEAAYDKPMANYWIHFEHLTVPEGKMSKSADNFMTLQTLVDKGYNPLTFRYFVLQTHYSKRMQFSWDALDAAATALNKLYQIITNISAKGDVDSAYQQRFLQAINNDLNTPQALAVVWDLIKDDSLNDDTKKATLFDFDKVLGLELDQVEPLEVPTQIVQLAEQRSQARKNGNFELADQLRQQIESQGYTIADSDDGYVLNKK